MRRDCTTLLSILGQYITTMHKGIQYLNIINSMYTYIHTYKTSWNNLSKLLLNPCSHSGIYKGHLSLIEYPTYVIPGLQPCPPAHLGDLDGLLVAFPSSTEEYGGPTLSETERQNLIQTHGIQITISTYTKKNNIT